LLLSSPWILESSFCPSDQSLVWPCLVSRDLLTRLALYYIIPRPSSLPSYTGRTSSTSVRFTLYTSPWSPTFNLQSSAPPINNQPLLQQLLQQHLPPLTYRTSYVLQLLRLYDSTRRAPLTRTPTPSAFHNLIPASHGPQLDPSSRSC
jgi:hypothetical protein